MVEELLVLDEQIEINKAIVRRIEKAKNDRDYATLENLFDSDFIAHISDCPQPMNRDQYFDALRQSHRAFSHLVYHILDMVAEKDKVAVYVQIQGRHTGPYQDWEASFHQIDFYALLIRRIVNKKVVEEWQVNDQLMMLKQIGLSVNHII